MQGSAAVICYFCTSDTHTKLPRPQINMPAMGCNYHQRLRTRTYVDEIRVVALSQVMKNARFIQVRQCCHVFGLLELRRVHLLSIVFRHLHLLHSITKPCRSECIPSHYLFQSKQATRQMCTARTGRTQQETCGVSHKREGFVNVLSHGLTEPLGN